MPKIYTFLIILSFTFLNVNAYNDGLTDNFTRGKAAVKSISTLTFGPEGILFIGDSKSGSVVAIDTEDKEPNNSKKPFTLQNVEAKIASLLGTTSDDIIIHDLAANPISQNLYLAVSRGDASSVGSWKLPNDINYAQILLKIAPDGHIGEVSLDNISHSIANIPSPKQEGQRNWRKSDKRTETITDLAYDNGKLYVAGISNEEFASSLRILPFPFSDQSTFSTIEIWHAAHGKFETEAPIRTFLPFEVNNTPQLLAAYTCTPLVSIPISALKQGNHVKTKTLAELGAGNIPLDIIKVNASGKDKILIANTNRTLMSIDPDDLSKHTKGLTEKVNGYSAAGVPYTSIPQVGVLQIDNLNQDFVVALKRMPNGSLDIISIPSKRV
ncbi:hypothetical protein QQ020_05210 [Fulvivirgaceae bacterium BMA12]|uniref:Uncharacterized protein n=1 Tax=Agaribacillus aureus TaxID=3051825 RepID=A0ABT8L132_9BACT|nr:hypothetical protein [Fulvivirgaceae bacterium BMA12]